VAWPQALATSIRRHELFEVTMLDKTATMMIIELLREIVDEVRAIRVDLRQLRETREGSRETPTIDTLTRLVPPRGRS
jgi:hypothetical protein